MPAHIAEAQEELSMTYGISGIARRLREIRMEKEEDVRLGKKIRMPALNFSIPVVMGNYSDNAHIFSSSDFQTVLFGANPTGSMTNYLSEVSYGQLNLSGTVYGPYTAEQTQAYYVGDDNGHGTDFPTNAGGFIYSVLGGADPNIDFSQYDNDGPDGTPNSGDDDGYVDAIIVTFPDGGAESGDYDNIWSHKWQLSSSAGAPYTTNDPRSGGGYIEIDVYTIQGGEQGNGTWNIIRPIGVFCHEFGHILGLPDLYDTDNSSYGVGTWCLMAAGSWGADYSYSSENRPTHMSAWCKVDLGWIIPTVTSGMQMVSIPPVENNPTAYKLWDDAYQGGRYFLIENRTQVGFDTDIYGEGAMIWHCNEDVCYDNKVDNFRLVDLEEADGLDQLDNRTSFMDAGDPYPGTSNNTSFNDFTYPNANDVFGSSTGVSAEGFTYASGSNIEVTLTQRKLHGFTIAYHGHARMRGWGYSSPQVTYGAVRYSSPSEGILFAVQSGVFSQTPVGYTVRIFDDMVGTAPQGLHSTTSGTFPNYPNRRFHEITLSSPLVLSNAQTFLVDVSWGPDNYAVPFTYRKPISGNSYFSGNGSYYYHWTDKDVLIRGRVQFTCVDNDGDGYGDPGFPLNQCDTDNCPDAYNPGQADGDGDGIGDVCDNCPTIVNENQQNSDTDSFGNVCDNCDLIDNDDQANDDTDSLGNACDNCDLVDNNDQANSDTDTLGNVCDNCDLVNNDDQINDDTDSLGNACDNCDLVDNDDQANDDTDTLGNVCDNCDLVDNDDQANDDTDSLGNACDNCPDSTNEDQADDDGDGNGNVCDICPGYDDNIDTDEDGYPDGCDNCPDVYNPDQTLDADADGVGDQCDNCPDDVNPNQENSENDTYGDACDNCPDSTNQDQADYDNDGIGDVCDTVCCDIMNRAGDADDNGAINLLDITYLIRFLYKEGLEPPCYYQGDANGSGNINLLDITYLINYIYKGGTEPECP